MRRLVELMLDASPQLVAPLGVVLLAIAFGLSSGFFLTGPNLLNVLGQAGPLAIIAMGQMAVLVTGGFDISVGAVVALSAVSAAMAVNQLGIAGLVIAPLVGGMAGVANGLLVGRLGVQPIIATLGMLLLARGGALLISGSSPVALESTGQLTWLGYGDVAGVPQAFLFALVLAVVVTVLLRQLRLGRRLYLVGSNRTGAALVGVNVGATLTWAYAFSGLSAGFASVVFLARAGAALPTFGDGLELQAIAAAVIGGTSLAGGSGSPLFVFIGALFIQLLANGLNLLGLSPFVREVMLGGVIVLAGLLDFVVRRVGALNAFRSKEWSSEHFSA